MSDLILEIKEMIISGLNLEDMSVSDIDENAPQDESPEALEGSK